MTSGLHRKTLIHGMLRAGFGVEDISIKVSSMGLYTSETHVRMEVARLRRDGRLMDVLALKWRRSGKAVREDECSGDHQPQEQASEGDKF